MKIVTLQCDKYKGGYSRVRLREDIAIEYQKVIDRVHEIGGIVTSSGGLRSLGAKVTATRSQVSMHYLGRAVDLYLYSGMVDPEKDPYVVEVLEDGKPFRVHVRCDGLPRITIDETINYKKHRTDTVGPFVDLTEIMTDNGFTPIPPKPAFWEPGRHDSAAEWWHFENRSGLKQGVTTFGDELLKVWTEKQLKQTGPWMCRDFVWNGSYFKRSTYE